jgi:Zn-dependent protease
MAILNRSVPDIIAFAITAILAFAYHEFAHAIVADRLGDPTPRQYGRISLNPIVHLNLFGLLMLFMAGFGWATTPVSPGQLRGNPRTSMAIVAVAGPAANFIMAILYALPIRLGIVGFPTSVASGPLADIFPSLFQLLIAGVSINLLLFAFNLLPIPPLDGFTILQGILPAELAYRIEPLRQYGTMILLAVLFLPVLLGINILGSVISPIVGLFRSVLLGFGF